MATSLADSVCPRTKLLSQTRPPCFHRGLLASATDSPLTHLRSSLPLALAACESACPVLSLLSPSLCPRPLYQNATALSLMVCSPSSSPRHVVPAPTPLPSSCCVLRVHPGPESRGPPPPAEGPSPLRALRVSIRWPFSLSCFPPFPQELRALQARVLLIASCALCCAFETSLV